MRHRFGVWLLVVWTATAAAVGSVVLGRATAGALDLPAEWGTRAAASVLTPASLAAGWLLDRLARRPPLPPLQRDVPWALAAFGVGLFAGFAILLTALFLIVPKVG
jgi:hypothetical protein